METRIWKKVGIGALIVVCALLALRVIFDQRFDNFSNYINARENAEDTDEFDRNFDAMTQWLAQYKKDHPGATDAEAAAAYEAGIRAL